MATKYLVSGSTDFGASASWATSRYGAGGTGLPTDDDEVFIVDGSQTVTTNLDALAAVDLQSLTVGSGFTGSIGTPGSSLEVEISNATTNPPTVVIEGNGAFVYLNLVGDGADDVTVDASGGANVFFTAGTLTLLKLRSGNVEVQNGCDLVTCHKSGGYLHAAYDATAITTMTNSAGDARIRRTITTGTLDAGTVTLDEESSSVSHTTLNIHGASVDLAISGTVTTANLYTGLIGPYGATVSPTITTVNRYGGMLVSRVGSTEMSIGTDNDLGGKSETKAKGSQPGPSGFGSS
jgi:hypothetical protein